MLQGNLIIEGKYRWNIEKWVFRKIMSLNFLNGEVEEFASKRSQSLVNVRRPVWLFEAKNL